jgi:hypothetical protein
MLCPTGQAPLGGWKMMTSKHKTLLAVDGVVNLALGVLLLLFPWGTAELLGVPQTDVTFYPSLLGAVIFGIGVALLIELYGEPRRVRGLGLGGAIAINIIGAGVLVIWLVVAPFDLPLRGHVTLWTIAVVVLGTGVVELLAKSWRY